MLKVSTRRARPRTLKRSLSILKSQMPELHSRYRVKSLGIFGSYARNEQSRHSDIDILVAFSKSPDLFEFMDLEEYLAELLDAKVDLVTRRALKGDIKKQILREVISV